MDFQIHSVVWAITYDDPVWPGFIERKNKKTFTIRFFAENSQANVPPHHLFNYQQYKEKYGYDKNNKNLQQAMRLAQNYIEKAKLKQQKNNNLRSKAKNLKQNTSIQMKELPKVSNQSPKQKSNMMIENKKLVDKPKRHKDEILEQPNPKIQIKFKSKKQFINEKANKKTQIHNNQLKKQLKKPTAVILPPRIVTQDFDAVQKQKYKQEKKIEQQQQQIMVIQKSQYIKSNDKENIAKNLKIQLKLQDIILLVIKNKDCEIHNLKMILKQFMDLYGQGLSIQKCVFTKIPKLMFYIKTKLIQIQRKYFQNQIKFIQQQHTKISNAIFKRFTSVSYYETLFNFNKNKIQENAAGLEEDINRPQAIIRILYVLRQLLGVQNQKFLQQYSCEIEKRVFNSKQGYNELLQRIQTHFNKSNRSNDWTMAEIENELNSFL